MPSAVATLPASSSISGSLCFHGANCIHHARGVAVRGIDRQHVRFFARHFLRALQKIAGGADRRAHAQASLLVFGGVGEFEFFLDVFYGDQAFEVVILIHHEQFFDAVALQDSFGFFERGAHGHGDEIFLGHDVADGLIEVALESQVAIRQDADSRCPRVTGSPDTLYLFMNSSAWRTDISGPMVTGSTIMPLSERFTRSISSACRSMRHIAVHESDAALPRDGDGQARVGDGVHGGGDDGNIQRDAARKERARIGVGGQHVGFAGHQQDIVESQTFGDARSRSCARRRFLPW